MGGQGIEKQMGIAPIENPESDTNGPEERESRTAPSGPDTAQQACGKMLILTQEKPNSFVSKQVPDWF